MQTVEHVPVKIQKMSMPAQGVAGKDITESDSCSVIVDLEAGNSVSVMNLNPGASYPAIYNSFYGALLFRNV